VLDMDGRILKTIGESGNGKGQFYYPTELRLDGQDLIVVDALNFRVQAFGPDGSFKYAIGKIGDSSGAMFRPKAVSVDSEGDLYVVDALWGVVQVFDRQGELLYYFGAKGTHAGQFQLPSGLFIDREDRVFVVDSYNRRIQQFQYVGMKKPITEAMR
jgi:DNA-binding beta-propeller fold protein YncE